MSLIIICDKCGKVIKDDKDKSTLIIKTAECEERGLTGQTTHVLCRKCKNKITKWLLDDDEVIWK